MLLSRATEHPSKGRKGCAGDQGATMRRRPLAPRGWRARRRRGRRRWSTDTADLLPPLLPHRPTTGDTWAMATPSYAWSARVLGLESSPTDSHRGVQTRPLTAVTRARMRYHYFCTDALLAPQSARLACRGRSNGPGVQFCQGQVSERMHECGSTLGAPCMRHSRECQAQIAARWGTPTILGRRCGTLHEAPVTKCPDLPRFNPAGEGCPFGASSV